ncbi:O-antigen polymerase [Longimicrobium sp.]|uniref:O-antigen polymerase n=1 Tax=Longimicrobium sp. TaxID=2029185 RepID=UPI002C80FC8D|nr:O-antigen polymerase [Longimicrobium sp.]HSU17095.1 O-antigen polymerase [Longimicrobium sp.]
MSTLASQPRVPFPASRRGRWEMPSQPDGSPFVRMKPSHRVMVLGFFLVYALSAGVLALLTAAPAAELVIPSLFLFIGVRMLPLIVYRSDYGWFHPLVLAAMLSVVHLAKEFPAYAFGLQYHVALMQYTPDQLGELVSWKLVLMALGLLAYYVGFRFAPRFPIPSLEFRPASNLRLKVPAVVLFSTLVFMIYLQGKGGLAAHVLSWGRGRGVSLAGDFYWFQLTSLATSACLIWFAVDRRAAWSPLFWMCFVAALCTQFLGSGSRGGIIYTLVIIVLVWMLRERKLAPTRMAMVGVMGMILLAVLGNLRNSTWQGSVDWSTLTDFSVKHAVGTRATGEIVSRRTVADGALPILAYVPGRVPHLYGASYLAALAAPVPRKFWPGKPGLVGGQVGRTFFGVRAGVPATAVGEAYWNFNIPGVLFAFAAFGVFHWWLSRVFLAYGREPLMMLMYIMVIWNAIEPSSDAVVGGLMSLMPLVVLGVAFGILRLKRY